MILISIRNSSVKRISDKSRMCILGFSSGASGKEPTCQFRRHKSQGFDPQARKMPWQRAWQPTPVFLPEKSPWREEPGG